MSRIQSSSQWSVRWSPFYGWYIVAACAVIAFYAWGLGFYGLGVYLTTLHRLHGWSVGFISVAALLYYLVSACVVLEVGNIIDRHGPNGVLAYGAVAMGLGVVALGSISAPWQLLVVYPLMATGFASLSLAAISATLVPWFNRRRGQALGFALAGGSVGGMALVPLLISLIAAYGFRAATTLAALLLWASVLPLVGFVIKRRPQDLRLAPDGGDMTMGQPAMMASRAATRAAAVRSPLFWTLVVPFTCALAAQVGFLVHQLNFLTPLLGPFQAVVVVSLTTLAALVGRVAMGFVVDSVDRRLFAAVCFTIEGAALAAVALIPTPLVLYGGSIGLGLGVGIVLTLPALLVQDEFGGTAYGAIVAMVTAGMQLGPAVGPSLVGVVHDRFNGYPTALSVPVVLEVLAAALVLFGWRIRRLSYRMALDASAEYRVNQEKPAA